MLQQYFLNWAPPSELYPYRHPEQIPTEMEGGGLDEVEGTITPHSPRRKDDCWSDRIPLAGLETQSKGDAEWQNGSDRGGPARIQGRNREKGVRIVRD